VAGALTGLLPPFVANRLRSAALRAAGLQVGRGSIFWGMPTIIGDDVEKGLIIGEECGFNVGCFIDVGAPITLGNHVAIGHHVMILSSSFTAGSAAQRAGAPLRAPVVIEDGAWVGARCTIMPGVTIGAGAVVGASMVISKDVPANTLLLGPQKISLAKWRS
jgi:maltose O-acetyltransferase